MAERTGRSASVGPAIPPAAASAIFGAALPTAERYATLLVREAVERGLLGPSEAGRIWDRHLLNCAAVAPLVPAGASVIDVGSGAGLPGVVLAMLLPDSQVTLVEPMQRRVVFLEYALAELGLGNARVVRGRAEDLAGRLAADVVTARAVAPLARLAGLCIGLARRGGLVVALKGASADAELAAAADALEALGVTDARVSELTAKDGDTSVTVVEFTAPGRP